MNLNLFFYAICELYKLEHIELNTIKKKILIFTNDLKDLFEISFHIFESFKY